MRFLPERLTCCAAHGPTECDFAPSPKQLSAATKSTSWFLPSCLLKFSGRNSASSTNHHYNPIKLPVSPPLTHPLGFCRSIEREAIFNRSTQPDGTAPPSLSLSSANHTGPTRKTYVFILKQVTPQSQQPRWDVLSGTSVRVRRPSSRRSPD